MSVFVQKLSAGEHSAFSELYDLYWTDLYRFVYYKVQNRQISEDILHDLFLSLWKNRERLQEINSLEAYLYSTCRYLIIAHYKKQKKLPYIEDEGVLSMVDNKDAPLEDRLHFRYCLDQVYKEIENLPDKCQKVFRLSREKHLTNQEISKRMNISESTVENHINKALRRLKLATKQFLTLFF